LLRIQEMASSCLPLKTIWKGKIFHARQYELNTGHFNSEAGRSERNCL
jgi:hypothetical protein